MSFISKLFHESDKLVSPSMTDRSDVQPMLLRHDETPAWVFNSSAWVLIIMVIAVGMIIFGYLLSQQKQLVSHQTHHVILPKAIKPVTIQQSLSDPVAPKQAANISVLYTNDEANKYYHSAVTMIKNGQISNAIQNLNKAITLNPAFNQAREALAALYIQTDNVSAAIVVLNKGLEISPDYYAFIKLKAQIFVNEGLFDKALMLLTENVPAIEQHPGYYALLAAVYNKEKKYMVAADIYRQLTQLNADNGQWWFGLGASLNLAGKTDEAKSAYQKALQAGGLKPDVRAYLESQLSA